MTVFGRLKVLKAPEEFFRTVANSNLEAAPTEQFMLLYAQCPEVEIVEKNGSLAVLLRGETVGFQGWVDPNSVIDTYSRELWSEVGW